MTRRFGTDLRTPAAAMVQRLQRAAPSEAFAALPAPTGPPPYRLELADVTTDPADELVFHVIGDSGGVKDPGPQKAVAAALAAEPGAFVYHVGDVVYFNGNHAEYFPQFYEPYEGSNRPIFAIPGNHDGDNSDDPAVRSLDAFVANFCAAAPEITVDAQDAQRDAMTQPNVYWTLRAARATIIGLYTNVPSGGAVSPAQAAWLTGELQAAPADRPLIVALHHPPYSVDAHHGGSARMGELLDAAVASAGRKPQLVLAGHVHDYQRFTRSDGVAYVVVGNSGYHNLHALAPDAKVGAPVPGSDVTLEAGDDKHWGYLRLCVTADAIEGSYVAVDASGAGAVADSFQLAV